MLNKGTASLEVKNSERNRELENFASLEPRVCEVLLYSQTATGNVTQTSTVVSTAKIFAVYMRLNVEDKIPNF